MGLTALLAVIARWRRIVKVTHKTYIYTDQRLTVIRYKMTLLILSFSFDSASSRSLLHQMREVMKKSYECMRLPFPINLMTFLFLMFFVRG